MYGAIAGDVIGSPYEWRNNRSTDFPLFGRASRFTDDSVMTVAVADWLQNDKALTADGLVKTMQKWGREYPNSGYGSYFRQWLQSDTPRPYGSYGNGSAMRVSAVGWRFDDLEAVLDCAKLTASVTHNHIEGVKGAQAVAAAIFMARAGNSKWDIREYVSHYFGYNLNRTCDYIRQNSKFDVTCEGSVPVAIIAFLESEDFEQAVRLAVSVGGDTDTIACMAGSIAEAFYGGVPEDIVREVKLRIPAEFALIADSI